MARKPRTQAAGIYHVTSLGAAAQLIFRDAADRGSFLRLLVKLLDRVGWSVYGYCLMGTHFHLLFRVPEDGQLALGMHWLKGCYAQTFNMRYRAVGHVFAARYVSTYVERETHLLETVRYIALNPVRAGLCRRPEDWPWSSYPALVGLVEPPPFLASGWVLGCFGGKTEDAQRRLRAFVESALD